MRIRVVAAEIDRLFCFIYKREREREGWNGNAPSLRFAVAGKVLGLTVVSLSLSFLMFTNHLQGVRGKRR